MPSDATDPPERQPTATADGKIFGIGLSRTGTLSLSRALTQLGIETRHYPDDPVTKAELAAGQYRLTLLETVQAITDIPPAPFYAQLDRAFPGSRFVLTTRDTDAWLASVENHFEMWVEHQRDAYDDFILACVYGSLHFSAERFRWVKEMHEENVRRYFAARPHDLLVLDVSEPDPWGLLCPFLGRPIPDEPYPHANRALSTPAVGKGRRARLAALARSLARR